MQQREKCKKINTSKIFQKIKWWRSKLENVSAGVLQSLTLLLRSPLLYHCSPSIALHHDEDDDDHGEEDGGDHGKDSDGDDNDEEDGDDNDKHAKDGDDDDIFLLQAPLSLFAPHCFAYHYKYLIGHNFELTGALIDFTRYLSLYLGEGGRR